MQVGLERRRVHRDQHVRRVAGRGDVVVRDVDLEARHTVDRARWGTDLGRIVGERRQVVAEQCTDRREAIAGELHAVARVAREPDDDVRDLLGCRVRGRSTVSVIGHLLRERTAPLPSALQHVISALRCHKARHRASAISQPDHGQRAEPLAEQDCTLDGAERRGEEEQAAHLATRRAAAAATA